MEELVANLKAVPAPRRARREGADVPLVPSLRASDDDEDEGD
jgi:hypothetical protein